MYRKIKYSLPVFTCFILTFCSWSSNRGADNWFINQQYNFAKIAFTRSDCDIYLLNDTIGFLWGSETNDSEQLSEIYRSEDGGKTFDKQSFGRGYINGLHKSFNGKYLYLQMRANSSLAHRTSHKILRSQDMGITWDSISTVDGHTIIEPRFMNDSIGFIFTDDTDEIQTNRGGELKSTQLFYITKDGGYTWEKTDVNIDGTTSQIIASDDYLMGTYLEDESLLWKMNIHTFQKEDIKLAAPEHLGIYGNIETDYLTGKHYVILSPKEDYGDEYYLYCIETKKMLELPGNSYHVSIYGDFIGILGSLTNNQYETRYYYTHDMGENWNTEIPLEKPITTICDVYGEGCVWAVTTDFGHENYFLQVRNISKKSSNK